MSPIVAKTDFELLSKFSPPDVGVSDSTTILTSSSHISDMSGRQKDRRKALYCLVLCQLGTQSRVI